MAEGERVEEPDPLVVDRARRGDDASFELLVRAYQAPVWRFVRHLVVDGALAEDVTQDVFVRAHRSLGGFDTSARFSSWLFAIARNAAIDAIRSRDRRRRLHAGASHPAPAASPEAGAELSAALAALPTPLREALLAVEVLGLTYDEAGEVLGVPTGTVKSRVHRARERLLGWMAAGDGEVAGGV